MTQQQHTSEPWRIEPATKKDNWRIVGANNQVVSTFSGNMDMDNALRIVAAVNACAGLDTEYLETVGLPEFAGKQLCASTVQQELDAVKAQRDQLRAVLNELCKLTKSGPVPCWADVWDEARAALAATEGKQ